MYLPASDESMPSMSPLIGSLPPELSLAGIKLCRFALHLTTHATNVRMA